MSKASQRKQSFYRQGYMDFAKKRGFRWKTHPYLEQYQAGWGEARSIYMQNVEPVKPWWRRLLSYFGI